jgi:uncharacterized membrane protein YsdA (DUF1294 family)
VNHISLRNVDSLALIWFGALNLAAFVTFAFDKWSAKRSARRVPELTLVLLGALGGWPGGLLAMNLFRHKTAKGTFKFKYALALVPCCAAIWGWMRWR